MKTIEYMFSGMFLLAATFSLNAQVGSPAPDFTVTDTDGKTHHLYDYLEAGKTVVLDFFYTTCGPCIFYSPQVNLAYEKYGCNNAEVVFMSIDYNDTNAEVIAYDEEYNIHYPSVSGLDGGGNMVVNQYGITGFPTFYVIDSSKTIVKQIDPPTLQVFDFRFGELGILPADCNASADMETSHWGGRALFPNPATGDRIFCHFPTANTEPAHYRVYDEKGRLVQSGNMEAGKSGLVELEIGELPDGLFLVTIHPINGSGIYSGKFVKLGN